MNISYIYILYNILDEHDFVFNTAGMNKKSEIFHTNEIEEYLKKYTFLNKKLTRESEFNT